MKDKGWVIAKDLINGDLLEDENGQYIKIDDIIISKEPNIVYNFEVEDFHTYYVSNLGIWTHNTSCNLSGPVEIRAKVGSTKEQIEQYKAYVNGSNEAIANGYISPTGRVSTKGKLRQEASKSAENERIRAELAGTPYQGHAGHVPDTTWVGKPDPYSWLDLDASVNLSIGGQANKYPVGYKPTEFIFVED